MNLFHFSCREGIDMLEIDHMLEKIKNLEAENERLKSIEATGKLNLLTG